MFTKNLKFVIVFLCVVIALGVVVVKAQEFISESEPVLISDVSDKEIVYDKAITIFGDYTPIYDLREEIAFGKKYIKNGDLVAYSNVEYRAEWYPDNSLLKDFKRLIVELKIRDTKTGKVYSLKGTGDVPKYFAGSFDFDISRPELVYFKGVKEQPVFTWQISEDAQIYEFEYSTKDDINKLETISLVNDYKFSSYKTLDTKTLSETGIDKITLDPDVSACGDLNTENGVYTLTQSINTTGTCFNIVANNITLDCQGYTINYSSAGITSTYGINITNYNLTTVKNCIIKQGAPGTTASAIQIVSSYNNTINNNTLIVTGSTSRGVYTLTAGQYHIITNNIINTTGATGVGLYLIINDPYIANNTIYTYSTTAYGIYLNGIQRARADNNTIYTYSTTAYGFDLNNARWSNLTNNKVYTTSGSSPPYYLISGLGTIQYANHSIDTSNLAQGKPVNYTYNAENLIFNYTDFTSYGQVIFGWSRNITISNSNFSSNGLTLFMTTNSTISNNLVNVTTGAGIWCIQDSLRNRILNNNVFTNASTFGYGIYLSDGSYYNTVDGNNITTYKQNGHGIYLSGSNFNNITNNNLTIMDLGTTSSIILALVTGSNSNLVTNLSGISNGVNGYGVYLSGANTNNILRNLDIITRGASAKGIYVFDNNNNFTVIDSKINMSVGSIQDLFIGSGATGGTWNFTNVTRGDGITPINVTWTAGTNGTLNMMWYADIYTNYTNGSIAPNVNITAWNVYTPLINNTLGRLDVGLVSYWNFDNDNASDAFDTTGRNNGSYFGGAGANVSGIIGNASIFNLNTDYIKVLDSDSLDIADKITISVFVYRRGNGGSFQEIVKKNLNYILRLDGSSSANISFYYWNSTNYTRALTIALPNNQWTHIVATANSSSNNSFNIYVNGILQTSTLSTASSSGAFTNFLTIGNSVDGTEFFNGSIDEVRIYNRTLSASEVQALYAEGYARNYTATTGSDGKAKISLLEFTQTSTSGALKTYFSNYTFNATTSYYDLTTTYNMSFNRNFWFTLDSTSANATLINPANASTKNNPIINFTVNATDIGEGLKNATLYIYNHTTGELVNQTTFTPDEPKGIFAKLWGIVVTLANGVYDFFYKIFDYGNNQFTTQNNTFTLSIDIDAPNFTSIYNMTTWEGALITQQITATDANNVSCFTVNDSFYNINCTGYLSTATEFPVSIRYLNISVNDTLNNIGSQIIWINYTAIDDVWIIANNSESIDDRLISLDAQGNLKQRCGTKWTAYGMNTSSSIGCTGNYVVKLGGG